MFFLPETLSALETVSQLSKTEVEASSMASESTPVGDSPRSVPIACSPGSTSQDILRFLEGQAFCPVQ